MVSGVEAIIWEKLWANGAGPGGSQAKLHKIQIGRVNKYFNKIKVAELSLEADDLAVGQKLLVTGPTTGALRFDVSEIRLAGEKVESAPKGSTVSVHVLKSTQKRYSFSIGETSFREEVAGEPYDG